MMYDECMSIVLCPSICRDKVALQVILLKINALVPLLYNTIPGAYEPPKVYTLVLERKNMSHHL